MSKEFDLAPSVGSIRGVSEIVASQNECRILVNIVADFRPSKDTPKSRRTRVRILDAAMRLFAQIGYHAASNGGIAEASDLTRGAMLYHFPTREDLPPFGPGPIRKP